VTEIDLGMPALASLVPISILSGIGMLLVFRRTSDQAAVRLAKSLVTAHLLEFRLFMDEPRLILKAQRDLIVANARFLKLMLRPLLVLALPMALLLAAMEGHTLEEVAAMLGLPIGTVKSRLFVGRKKLAEKLQCYVTNTKKR